MTQQTTEALAELVALDDLKRSLAQAHHHAQMHPSSENYDVIDGLQTDLNRRRKPAWEAARAALSSQPPAPTDAFDITLDEAATKLLAQTITGGDPDEDTWMRVRLLHGEGHDGHGLYVASADYPAEGATLLTATAGSTKP